VLSNTHSAGSESKDSDFSAQNQNLAGCVITTTRERILNDWNGLFEEEKLAMQHSRSLSPAKQKQQEKLRRAAILLRFQDECIGTELIRQREHIKKIYNRFTEEYQLYINLQSTEAKKRYTETRRMVRFLEEKLNEEETKWALPLTPSLLNEQDNLSDTTSTRDLLLQKWNTSTLTSEEREKVRRGAVLLGVVLPQEHVPSLYPDKQSFEQFLYNLAAESLEEAKKANGTLLALPSPFFVFFRFPSDTIDINAEKGIITIKFRGTTTTYDVQKDTGLSLKQAKSILEKEYRKTKSESKLGKYGVLATLAALKNYHRMLQGLSDEKTVSLKENTFQDLSRNDMYTQDDSGWKDLSKEPEGFWTEEDIASVKDIVREIFAQFSFHMDL
jgi:hypothetical protein